MSEPSVDVRIRAERAKGAGRVLACAPGGAKNRALQIVADKLGEPNTVEAILAANEADIAAAAAGGLDAALVDRLRLTPTRISAMVEAVRFVASSEDPVGAVVGMERRPNGLLVGRSRIPLGVIAIIYESRPNVTIEAASLALKSGNAIVLRGGKEARRSNEALVEVLRASLREAELPEDAVQFLPPADRDEIRALVSLTGLIDLVIPRGGEALIRFVTEHARVPVIQHYKGVCHMFVDRGADHAMAERLVVDAKLSRVGVCNALECLLVDAAEAEAFLPRLAAHAVEIRADARTCELLPSAKPASEDDWGREFLAEVLAVRVVDGIDGALRHIARYGSNHTEAIVTNDYGRAQRFLREADASCVLVNASTRFNDGGQLGLGAEMGISTSKLHAYGPMGLEHLTTLKWIVFGEGQVRGG